MTFRDMSEPTRMQYLRSEITVPPTVYAVAGQIDAAYVQAGQVASDPAETMQKAVNEAIEIAIATEKTLAGAGLLASPGLG